MNNKKIYMILTNGFDPDVRVYKEARFLVENGFDVEILCWDRRCQYKNKKIENVEGIRIRRFLIPSTLGSGMKQLLPFFKYIIAVRKYLKKSNYQYLHCHDFDGIIVGLFTKNRKKKKIVFDMHEIYTHYSYAKNRFFKKIFNWVIKQVQYVIYVNDEQLKLISSKCSKIFLPNYPNRSIYHPIDKTFSKDIRVNYIGSLRDYEALSSLASIDKKGIVVGFYGWGVCYDKLKANYHDDNIFYYGSYDGIKESGNIYQNTDILYCCYNPKIENWKKAYPVKFYEAIVTCTPIIVSKGTDVSKFVKKTGIGEIVEFGNILEIENAISKIAKNKSKYINKLKNMSHDYEWETLCNKLLEVYSEQS